MRATNVIVLAGPAGAGKSSAATLLGETRQTVVLDKDDLTSSVTESLLRALGKPSEDRDSDVYKEQVRPLEYWVLERAAVACAQAKIDVVIDAPFIAQLNAPEWKVSSQKLFSRCGAKLWVVWLHSAPEVRRDRLVKRACERDNAKLANWGPEAAILPPPTSDYELDTTTLS